MHGTEYPHRMSGLCLVKDMVYGLVHRVHALHNVQSGATPSWKVLWPDMPHAIYPMHMLVFNAWTFG